MIFAVRGSSSEMCRPGTEVGIARNGPPVAVPGLGSDQLRSHGRCAEQSKSRHGRTDAGPAQSIEEVAATDDVLSRATGVGTWFHLDLGWGGQWTKRNSTEVTSAHARSVSASIFFSGGRAAKVATISPISTSVGHRVNALR